MKVCAIGVLVNAAKRTIVDQHRWVLDRQGEHRHPLRFETHRSQIGPERASSRVFHADFA